jgi:hypothetical protein
VSEQASLDLALPRHRRRKRKWAAPANPAFAEALRDAAEIRRWTDGPRAAPWRIYRLAQALVDQRHG